MRPLERLRRLGAGVALGGRVLRSTGLLEAMTVRGLVDFARAARRGRPGPSSLVYLHAANTPDKDALLDGDVRLSYRALAERVHGVAVGLARAGVRGGDHVAVMLPNCHQYIELQLALPQLGATAVQVGYRLKAPEVRYILENSGARAFVYADEYAAAAREALVGLPRVTRVLVPRGRAGAAAAGERPYEDLLADGPLPDAPSGGGFGGVMVYTSGTTGRPKGALRDFRRTGAEPVAHFLAQLPLRHDERHLCVCPLYHSAAPAFTALTFGVGGTVVLLEHFDAEVALATMQRERITSSLMVPTMLSRLVNLPDPVSARYDTSSLRWLMSAAAPLPTALAARVEARFGSILYNFYGATETGLVTLALPGEHTARPGTIGRLLGGNEIRLLDEAGRDVPRGEIGELWVKNSMLVDGYFANDDATRAARRDGFFFVGDLARLDDDGYLYLTGRKHDMIISGGVNIYPLEIEQHLHTHPAIADCAVVGVPDEEWGEALCAFVVRREGRALEAAEVAAFCREALADYKRPRRVLFVDALPRNATGKVLRDELRQWAKAAT